MPRIRDVMLALEEIAPSRYALSFDRIGLQLGDAAATVSQAVVSLDRSLGAVAFARETGAQLLISHHPLLFRPLDRLLQEDHVGRTAIELVVADIAFAAAHTNWDAARGGINDALAEVIDLQNVDSFGTSAEVDTLKLVCYTPADAVDAVIDAASSAGAGVIGSYRRCAFLSNGQGTFYGGEGTNPTVGAAGQVERAEEVRIEMVLPARRQQAVAEHVRRVHPYEEPAFDFLKLASRPEQPLGRVGDLREETTLLQLCQVVDTALQTRCWAWGAPEGVVRRVAAVGGAADDEWRSAQRAGAEVLITGEVKQHVALEASESGMAIIAAGHYATEQPGCAVLRDRLAHALPEVNWRLFTPTAGRHGRPLMGKVE